MQRTTIYNSPDFEAGLRIAEALDPAAVAVGMGGVLLDYRPEIGRNTPEDFDSDRIDQLRQLTERSGIPIGVISDDANESAYYHDPGVVAETSTRLGGVPYVHQGMLTDDNVSGRVEAKPYGSQMRNLARRMDVPVSEIVLIEDIVHDAAEVRNAGGLAFILVEPTGRHDKSGQVVEDIERSRMRYGSNRRDRSAELLEVMRNPRPLRHIIKKARFSNHGGCETREFTVVDAVTKAQVDQLLASGTLSTG